MIRDKRAKRHGGSYAKLLIVKTVIHVTKVNSVEEIPNRRQGGKSVNRAHRQLREVREVGKVGLQLLSHHSNSLQLALIILKEE